MRSTPTVSICCTAHDHEAFIRASLEGFLAQRTDFRFEVIVHDDASTDGTAAIIREFEERAPEIIRPIYQTENQFTKERGRVTRIVLEAARGEFIALCEGDDFWTDPHKLQRQVDVLRANPGCAGCFHRTGMIDAQGILLPKVFGDHGDRRVLSTVDTFSGFAPFHTSSFVFRRSALRMNDWFPGVVSGDMALFSIVSASGDLYGIPEVMSMYRKHAAGVTAEDHIHQVRHHRNRIDLMRKLDAFHHGRFRERALEVIALHQREIDQLQAREHALRPWWRKLFDRLLTAARRSMTSY